MDDYMFDAFLLFCGLLVTACIYVAFSSLRQLSKSVSETLAWKDLCESHEKRAQEAEEKCNAMEAERAVVADMEKLYRSAAQQFLDRVAVWDAEQNEWNVKQAEWKIKQAEWEAERKYLESLNLRPGGS